MSHQRTEQGPKRTIYIFSLQSYISQKQRTQFRTTLDFLLNRRWLSGDEQGWIAGHGHALYVVCLSEADLKLYSTQFGLQLTPMILR